VINSKGAGKHKVGTWECDECDEKENTNDKGSCIGCGKPRGGGFPELKIPEGWKCPTCTLRNDLDKTICLSCKGPRPGNDEGAASTGTADATAAATTTTTKQSEGLPQGFVIKKGGFFFGPATDASTTTTGTSALSGPPSGASASFGPSIPTNNAGPKKGDNAKSTVSFAAAPAPASSPERAEQQAAAIESAAGKATTKTMATTGISFTIEAKDEESASSGFSAESVTAKPVAAAIPWTSSSVDTFASAESNGQSYEGEETMLASSSPFKSAGGDSNLGAGTTPLTSDDPSASSSKVAAVTAEGVMEGLPIPKCKSLLHKIRKDFLRLDDFGPVKRMSRRDAAKAIAEIVAEHPGALTAYEQFVAANAAK